MTEIYLNNAGHGRPDASVLARTRAHLAREAEIGPDRARAEVVEELDGLTHRLAGMMGADPARVDFGYTTCAVWAEALLRLPLAGRRVLIAPHEWVDNVELLARLGPQMGLVVEVLPELDLDAPDLDPWAARIDEDVVAISLPHVTSVAGLRYPLEEIAALPRPEDCRLLVDGAQGIGQVPLALEGSGVDLYTGTCRKWLRGPKQTAVIWCSEALGMAPQALRPNDTHVGVRLGLARAVEMAADYPAELAPLSEHVRTKAAALGLPCLSTPASGTTAITIEVPLAAKDRAAAALTAEGILIKWPDAAADEPHSHLATEPRAMIRIAPHVANQAHEIDRLFEVIGRHL